MVYDFDNYAVTKMRVWGPLEHLAVMGFVTGDERYYNLAKELVERDNYTLGDLDWSRREVGRYLRTRGHMQMLPPEHMALLKMQAVCRGFLVRR